jgi:hypothetical protein
VLDGWSEPGGNQERSDFVAIQAGGVRFVVQSGAADVHGWAVIQEFFFDGVPGRTRRWRTAAG